MAKKDDLPEDGELTISYSQLKELLEGASKAAAKEAVTAALSVQREMQDYTSDDRAAERMAEIVANATAKATEAIHPTKDIPYPGISPFNPEGQLANPLPELKGEIYWVGYRLVGDELTRQEIELLNRVVPGDFEIRSRAGDMLPFKVRDLDPGSKTSRRLLIMFPCATADQRHNVPSMVEMLQQILTPEPVPA